MMHDPCPGANGVKRRSGRKPRGEGYKFRTAIYTQGKDKLGDSKVHQ